MEGTLLFQSNKCQLSEIDFLVHQRRLTIRQQRLWNNCLQFSPDCCCLLFQLQTLLDCCQTLLHHTKFQRLSLENCRHRKSFVPGETAAKHRRNGRRVCHVDFFTLLVGMVFIAFSICWSSRVPKLYVTKGCLDDLIGSCSSNAMAPKPFASMDCGHARHFSQAALHFELKTL